MPIGDVVVLGVDDDADDDRGSAVAPWQTEPDSVAPHVTWARPADGGEGLAVTSRFGVTFNEMVDVRSAWEGSVRRYETGTDPDVGRVDGWVSAQENTVNVHPRRPLKPGTARTPEIPAGGLVDFDGNAIEGPFVASFRTAD